ncbi:MAG: hypothetical protein WBE52_01730, partial [Terriglobales bacterium]
MSMRMMREFELLRWVILVGLMAWTASGVAQEAANRGGLPSQGSGPESLNDSVRELREQVRELQAAVADMRSDSQRAHTETVELRRQLDEIRAGAGSQNAVLRAVVVKTATNSMPETNSLQNAAPQDEKQEQENQKKSEHTASLDEEYQLLSGKVDDQYQTKVESASKYRLRVSGIVLMNLISNQGVVDSIDLPTL